MNDSSSAADGAFDEAAMTTWIREMTAWGPRRAGSQAGHHCEDYLVSKLQSFGIADVRKEAIPVEVYEVNRFSLEVNNGGGYREIEGQWIPHCAFTPDAGLTAALVYADPGKLFQGADWKGKIVVTDISFPDLDLKLLQKFSLGAYDPHDTIMRVNHPATWVRMGWHFYKMAREKGAVGFIGILKDQPGGSCKMYAPYGFKEKNILDKPLPGCWVSRKDRLDLIEMARSGAATAKLTLCGTRKPGVTHNIVGEIRGNAAGAGEEVMVMHSHHDSPFVSPVEDASGCAVVLAVAKHFAASKELKRNLTILLTAGHFYGSIATRTFIRDHKDDVVPRVVLEMTVEHVAKEAVEDSAGNLVESGLPEGTGVFAPFNGDMVRSILKNLEENDVHRVFILPAEGPLGDFPPTDGGDWYEAGVPLINMISNPVYPLNAEDDYSWVMGERLPKVASCFIGIIRDADTMDRETIARVEFKAMKAKMKLVKLLARAKTTRFGTRPVY